MTIPAYGTALFAFSQQNLSGGKTADVHAVQSDCPVICDVHGNLAALVADGDPHTLVFSDGTVKTVQVELMPVSEKIDSWTLAVESWHLCGFSSRRTNRAASLGRGPVCCVVKSKAFGTAQAIILLWRSHNVFLLICGKI